MKTITKTKAKQKAWKIFSQYIRMKDADHVGFVRCYTCPTKAYWKDLDAGHGIPGRNNAVLFLEAIVKPQCKGCNIWGRGQLAKFTRRLIDELGIEEYDRLVSVSNTPVQYKTHDYLEIYQKYFEKVNEL